ncbi:hypothetical protein HMPREF9959_0004, partial [Streptococcus mitis SK569]
KQVHPLFQTVFKTFLKEKEKIVNALQLPYSNAKLEATNNLIKLIKRNAFGFRNFENFKKRIFIALNIKKERTKCVLSRLYTICSGYIPYGYYGAYFVVEKKSHKIYNEKRSNNSLERILWNNYILSQNY